MIPENWQAGNLGDGIKLISGQHIDADDYSGDAEGIPYLTGPADFPDGKILVTKYTTKPKVICESGDILLTVKGSGTGQIVRADKAYCISRQLMAIRTNDWDTDFIFHVLETNQAKYGNNASGLIPGITRQDVLNTPVFIPPLEEQRKIAEILNTWDGAIALTEALIAALGRRKQALMQVLLTGEVRFQEFEGAWEDVRIGDVASLTAGGTPSTYAPEYWGGEIRWMSSGEVHQKRIYEVEGRITEQGLNNSSAKLIPINSVLVALAGQGKTRGTVAINKVELSTNQSIATIMPDSRYLHYEFLFYNLDNRYDELRRLSTGDGGRGGLNLQILKGIYLLKPSVPEQQKISDALNVCDDEIGILKQYRTQLQTQKRGLMQQLLTGAVRV